MISAVLIILCIKRIASVASCGQQCYSFYTRQGWSLLVHSCFLGNDENVYVPIEVYRKKNLSYLTNFEFPPLGHE